MNLLDFSDFKIVDSHIHLYDLNEFEDFFNIYKTSFKTLKEYTVFVSLHSKKEFDFLEELKKKLQSEENLKIFTSFAIHPQNPSLEEFDFLEFLLKNKKIDALGEFGFDLFSDSFKKNISNQEKAFNIQLELSLFYNVPVVLHFRKGLEYIYRYAEKLKKLPGILFHSFFWSDFEALSILNKIESSFFSFGKSLLKLNKKSFSCVKNLPLSAILLETDAPFQTLKNEVYTKEDAIFEVYKSAYKIKKDYSFENKSFFEFSEVLANNFNILLSN